MSKSIYCDLTESQRDDFRPLFEQAEVAALKGKENRGVVFAQVTSGAGIKAKFIPVQYSSRVIAILREMVE